MFNKFCDFNIKMRSLVSKYISRLKSSVKEIKLPCNVEESWIRFGISTFHKTRYHSHVSFPKTCLKKRIIPQGFQLRFHHGPSSSSFSLKNKFTVEKCSFQLMRNVLFKYSKIMVHLTKERETKKQDVQERTPDVNSWRHLSTVVHHINRDLYDELDKAKNSKLQKLLPSRPTEEVNLELPKVVRIPETLPLSEDEEQLLQKGLSFVPTSKKVDPFTTLDDTENFFRKVRLKAYFANVDTMDNNVEMSDADEFVAMKPKHKKFTPKPGQFEAVDTYIKTCKKEINKVDLQKSVKVSNLSVKEMAAMRSLKRRDDIVVKPADKGGAVCVWRKDLYIKEGMSQLENGKFYKKLDKDDTEEIQKRVDKAIKALIDDGSLQDTAKFLLVPSPRSCAFYLLPKIHKEGIPGRPVVSNISCPTYNISKFLSGYLKPLVQKSFTFIRDSTHLLQKLDDFKFKDVSTDNKLFTMDVKGLYTNIPNKDGLVALKYHLENREEKDIPTCTLLRLAELVLTENCMEFNGEFYKQINGTMMGTPFSVEYSCLFMVFQEIQIFEEYSDEKPSMFVRYIDDIFGVSELPLEKLDNFISFFRHHHEALDYTVDISTEVSMLDTMIKVEGNRLVTSLYTKPTDSHSYLLYNSSHPKVCKDSLPYSQFMRIRRICSSEDDFEKKSKEMAKFFVQQKYPKHIVEKQRKKVLNIPRKDILHKETSKEKNERMVFPIMYHPTNMSICKTIKRNYAMLENDEEVSHIFSDGKPMIAFRRDRNLRDILVHSRLQTQNISVGTAKCGRPRCLTCDHISPDVLVVGPKGSFKAKQSFSCTSTGLVYAIECQRCGYLYVGETGRRLADRFREHRRNVVNKNSENEVALHFNMEGHEGVKDMKVMGLKFETELISRKLQEQKIIAKLGCVLGGGMNTDFNFPRLLD